MPIAPFRGAEKAELSFTRLLCDADSPVYGGVWAAVPCCCGGASYKRLVLLRFSYSSGKHNFFYTPFEVESKCFANNNIVCLDSLSFSS